MYSLQRYGLMANHESATSHRHATGPPVYGSRVQGIAIRAESPTDVATIEVVTVAAFASAPHTAGTEQFIVGALRRADALTVSLVAELAGELIGHVAISPVTLSDGSPGWFGLGPISVLPEHQGRGIGSQLMEESLLRLRELGAAGCVLVGEPRFYTRFGFRAQSALTYPDVPAEVFLVLPIGGSVPIAAVTFHPAFGATE